MSAKMLPQLGYNNSKEDELAFLQIVRQQAGEQSYVASLISEELVKWFGIQIKDDVSPDIWATLQTARKQAEMNILKATELACQHENEAARLRKELAEATDAFDKLERVANEEHARFMKERHQWEEALGQVANERNAYGEEVQALREQVAGLKQLVFDLEHPALKLPRQPETD